MGFTLHFFNHVFPYQQQTPIIFPSSSWSMFFIPYTKATFFFICRILFYFFQTHAALECNFNGLSHLGMIEPRWEGVAFLTFVQTPCPSKFDRCCKCRRSVPLTPLFPFSSKRDPSYKNVLFFFCMTGLFHSNEKIDGVSLFVSTGLQASIHLCLFYSYSTPRGSQLPFLFCRFSISVVLDNE